LNRRQPGTFARRHLEGLDGGCRVLGHRDQDEMLKAADTDFPEPDAEAEHSGE